MPSIRVSYDKGEKWSEIEHKGCFGSIWNSLDKISVKAIWDANTKAPSALTADGYHSRTSMEDVKRFVELLKRTGLKFTYGIEDAWFHWTVKHSQSASTYASLASNTTTPYSTTDKVDVGMVPAHTFTIMQGENSILLTKVILTTARWLHNYPTCLQAYISMCNDQAPTTELEYFNLLCISALAVGRYSAHTITCTKGYIRPFTQEEYDELKIGKNDALSMEQSMKIVPDVLGQQGFNVVFGAQYPYGGDLAWLAQPGGYGRYMNELAKAQEAAGNDSEEHHKKLIGDALGIAA